MDKSTAGMSKLGNSHCGWLVEKLENQKLEVVIVLLSLPFALPKLPPYWHLLWLSKWNPSVPASWHGYVRYIRNLASWTNYPWWLSGLSFSVEPQRKQHLWMLWSANALTHTCLLFMHHCCFNRDIFKTLTISTQWMDADPAKRSSISSSHNCASPTSNRSAHFLKITCSL